MRPDTITITIVESVDMIASAADLSITIEGASLFIGDEALRKAREVVELVAALSALKIPADSIQVTDVRVGSDGFFLLKSSSCRYSIRIRELPTDRIPSVVATIAASKGAELSSLRWRFSDVDQHISTLREKCLARSRSEAHSTATALGLKIVGVYRHKETVQRPDGQQSLPTRASEGGKRMAAMQSGSPSMPGLSFTGRLMVSMETQYRVSLHSPQNNESLSTEAI